MVNRSGRSSGTWSATSAASVAPSPEPAEATTRELVLRDISTLGPITTSGLVDRLGLTETAIRRHVENLLADGLIEAHRSAAVRRGRGRPAKSWVLSARGHAHLRSDYDDLAGEAIRFLAEHSGTPAVRAFAERRAEQLRDRCASSVPAVEDSTVEERTHALVAALNREGYAASARPVGGPDSPGSPALMEGLQLCQGHCPVQHVAQEFPEFCDAETEVISEILGVHVQRLATLAHGAHACTTYVPGVVADPAITSERSSR